MSEGKCALVLQFATLGQMVEFVDGVRDDGTIDHRSGVYHMDQLHWNDVKPDNYFILRRVGELPDERRLSISIQESTTRVV